MKTHRIVAPKKPATSITTSSWRVGQEIQRKVMEEMKDKHKTSMPPKQHQPSVSLSLEQDESQKSESRHQTCAVTYDLFIIALFVCLK